MTDGWTDGFQLYMDRSNPFLPKLFCKTAEKPQEMKFYGLCDLCAICEDPPII